ncbi:MAG: DegV family EDD domain-containing protein [Oscillospiraceae bacterium]|nr:DegV family EDD domain-containing protein [Oscillospiraceae bacterium]
MVTNIVISADCTCDLPESLVEKYNIKILPFYINYKGTRFKDGDEITASSLVEYLKKQDEVISSSAPDIEEYREYFKRISQNGEKQVIHITIAKKLSIAYKNAVDASRGMEYVHIVDSGSASHGMGLFTLATADFASRMNNVESVVKELKKVKEKINCSFILRSTFHLANNRRLNQFISNMLTFFKIRPIIRIDNDDLRINGLYIGNRESYARKFVKQALRSKNHISDDILFISVGGCSDEIVNIVYDEATKQIPWKKIYVADVSSTCLCNIGAHSIGLMFCKK